MRIRRVSTWSLVCVAVAMAACSGDPNDPRTWAKKLKDLRAQREALERLANMDTDRAKAALPELIELYKDTRNPDHLNALVRFKAKETEPLFIEALEFSDSPETIDRAAIAAGALGEMKSEAAVDALTKTADKQLPIKSRGNIVRLAAIRALVKIGDKRAVPTLSKILTTSADEQDFLLNQKAALGLAELRDPEAVPALIKGLFMTGRGANIFQECRLALVRIGQPSIDPLIALLQGKNQEIAAMSKQLEFDKYSPGVITTKAAWVLGDLRSPKGVPPLLAALKQPAKGGEHTTIAIALGTIGSPEAVDTLIALAKDPKTDPRLRLSATDALYLSGDKRAVPVLLDIAKNGYVTVEGQKTSELRANAAVDLSRIGGKEHYDAFKALAEKETEAEGVFGEALDRLQVARDCDKDTACYVKMLQDPAPTRAEKAAFALGFSGDKKAVKPLLDALKPLKSLGQDRYPVHQAILFALTRLADKSCNECVEKLTGQIEKDETAVRIPGARDLLGETRVALAVIQSQ